MEFYHRHDQSLKSLIHLATFGHYPLFEREWLHEALEHRNKLTGNEKSKAKTLLKRLCDHRTIERKKVVLSALKPDDRKVVVKAFLKLVETKMLNNSLELH